MTAIKLRFVEDTDQPDQVLVRVFAGKQDGQLQSTGVLRLKPDEAHLLTGILLGTVDGNVDVTHGDRGSSRWDVLIEPVEEVVSGGTGQG